MIHKTAIEHIVRSIPGAINNHYAKRTTRIMIDRRVPDIVVKGAKGRVREVYEVETFHKLSLSKQKGVKRILVIALEDDDWEEVKVLTNHGKLRASYQELMDLEKTIRIQRGRLKGVNTKLGHQLSFAKGEETC